MKSPSDSHPTGLDTTPAEPLGGKPRSRPNRRQLLKRGLGAVAAAKLVSISGFADAASAAPVSSAKTPSLASQSGTVNLRFMRFAGPQWIFDTNFVNQFMEENPNITVEGEDV